MIRPARTTLRTQGMSDALMAQAHAQQRDSRREPRDDVVGDSSLHGRARSGRDDQVGWRGRLDLLERDLVVADDLQVDTPGRSRRAAEQGCR